MPLVTFSAGQVASPTDVNANFGIAMLVDTSRTVTVTHTYTASQTFTGGWTAAAACTISGGGLTSTALTLSTAASQIVPGATSLTFRNNADSANNVVITDAGNVYISRGGLLFLVAVSKIIPGATSLSFRNNADTADNLIITDAGAATFRSTVGGITTLTATTLAGTLSTAAQASVTSLGTLTSLTTSGTVRLTAADSKIIPGTSSIAFRNNADGAANLSISDAGLITFRSGVTISSAVQLGLVASTTAEPSLFMPAGTAPSIPADGSMWYDGTNVKFQTGAGTKTFTLT